MTFKSFAEFKEKFDAGSKDVSDWPGVLPSPGSSFLLLQNQAIVPGWRFVVSLVEPFYVARVQSFETQGQAREYCLAHDGVMIAGRNACIVFFGVADQDRFPVSINYRDEIGSFMSQAALWLQGKGG